MHVVHVPSALDDQTFEQLLGQVALAPPDARLYFDASHTTWASPYGLCALLCLGQSRAEPSTLTVPLLEETRAYWSRMAFFCYAEDVFELHGAVPPSIAAQQSSTTLEITPISAQPHVHVVLERVVAHLVAMLTTHLRLDGRTAMGFAMTVSELCQHVIESSSRGGWVAAQTFNHHSRLGSSVLELAVCHTGQTLRQGLTSRGARALDDTATLERDVRFKRVRAYVAKCNGRLAVRSGVAEVAIGPSWTTDTPRVEQLGAFPGVQVIVQIPESLHR